MAITIPVDFAVTSNLDDELNDAARAGERVSQSIGSGISRELDESAGSARRFAINAEGAASGADTLASGSSQAAGGLGDLGGALSLIPGPLGGLGTGMELAAPAIMGVTGAADLVNLALEKMKLATIGAKVATFVKTGVDKAAAVATNILAGATRALGLAVRFATGPVGLIILGLTALVTALVVAYKNSETFRNIVNGVFEAIKGVVLPILDAIVKAVEVAFQVIMDVISGAVNIIKKIVEGIFKAISAVITFYVDAWVKAIKIGVKIILGIFRGIAAIVGVVSDAVRKVVGLFVGLFVDLAERVGRGIGRIIDFFLRIPKAVLGLGKDMLNAGKHLIGKLFEGIQNAAGAVGGFVANIAGKLKDGINDLLNLPLTVGPLKVLGKTVLPKVTLIPEFARGTDFAPGGIALVGEEGPELVNLPRGSRVNTASETRDMLGGETKIEVNQNFYGPNTSAGRLRELEWTLRFATGRLPRQGVVAA